MPRAKRRNSLIRTPGSVPPLPCETVHRNFARLSPRCRRWRNVLRCITRHHNPTNMIVCKTRGGGILDVASDKRFDVVAPLLIQAFRLSQHLCWVTPAKAGNGEEF